MRHTSKALAIGTTTVGVLTALTMGGSLPAASAMSGGTPVPQAGNDVDSAAAFANVSFAPGAIPGADDPMTRNQCGGALIAPDRIVTAAHCVVDPGTLTFDSPAQPLRPEQLVVTLGAAPLSDAGVDTYAVTAVSVSPGFHLVSSPEAPGDIDRASASDDIAELTLDRPAVGITPLARSSSAPAAGTHARFYGHGWTPQNQKSDALLYGDLAVMSPEDCMHATSRTAQEPPVLCAETGSQIGDTASAARESVQAGYGDSGGPLVAMDNGVPTLLGVFSFGTETLAPLFTPGFNAFTPV